MSTGRARFIKRLVGIPVGVLLLLGAGTFAWLALSELRDQRAWDRHMAEGEPYAARLMERTGVVPASLRESSGVAASRTHAGVLWSHNDSGGEPVIIAIDSAGRELARFRLARAAARDWEDIALGRCPHAFEEERDCLYVGDVGDNYRRRAYYSIYITAEPDPRLGPDRPEGTAYPGRVDFLYPDEAHDSEALAVNPAGDIVIVTKGRTGEIAAYGLDRDSVDAAVRRGARGNPLTARRIGTLPIRPDFERRFVSGAAFSPSGARLAVRTYSEIFFFAPDGEGGLEPVGERCFLGDLEVQGEAVDFLDEETLILTSEVGSERPGTIHRVRCD